MDWSWCNSLRQPTSSDLHEGPDFVALGAVIRRDLLRRMQQNSDLHEGPVFVAFGVYVYP